MMAETVDDSTTRQTKPYFLALLGGRLCQHGRIADGLARLDEGLALAAETDERLWEPLLRLTRAQWLLASGDPAGEAAVQAALDVATRSGQRLLLRRHAEWEAALPTYTAAKQRMEVAAGVAGAGAVVAGLGVTIALGGPR